MEGLNVLIISITALGSYQYRVTYLLNNRLCRMSTSDLRFWTLDRGVAKIVPGDLTSFGW